MVNMKGDRTLYFTLIKFQDFRNSVPTLATDDQDQFIIQRTSIYGNSLD